LYAGLQILRISGSGYGNPDQHGLNSTDKQKALSFEGFFINSKLLAY